MDLLKFQADQIFTGKTLLKGNYVLITNKNGEVRDIVDQTEAGEDIKHLKGLLTPGFINCHCHLELSHMRGKISEKTGLVDFALAVIGQRFFAEDEILQGIAAGENEMLKNGIVAVGDICNTTNTLDQKLKGNLKYYNFAEALGWNPSTADQRLHSIKSVFDAFAPNFPTAIVPHAPYSVSADLWKKIEPFYENKVASMHNQECRDENELFKSNTGDFLRMYQQMGLDNRQFNPTGKSSLQAVFYHFLNAAGILLVHNTFTSAEDIAWLQTQPNVGNVSFCLCPNANLYIENSLPDVEMLHAHGFNIVLGTDSLASNYSLSIWDEIVTLHEHFPKIPLENKLQWATLNGATALQMDDQLGSFEKGKKPGVVLLENLFAGDDWKNSKPTRIL